MMWDKLQSFLNKLIILNHKYNVEFLTLGVALDGKFYGTSQTSG
jgi:hypothetical protein